MTVAPVLAAINWTDVLLYGVPAYIAALGSAIAAVLGSRNHKSLRTSNGKTIGQQVEATHTAVNDAAAKVEALAGEPPPPDAPPIPAA